MRAFLVRRKLLIVICAAVLARLLVLVAFPDVFAFSEPGRDIHGSAAYDDYALNLLETGVYGRAAGRPDSVLPPLYSIVLAALYGLFGRSYVAVCLAHILLDALSIALLYDIARRLLPSPRFRGEWIGTLAGLFFALYPYLIFQNLTLSDTALWIFLLHLFVWLMVTAARATHARWRHAGAGGGRRPRPGYLGFGAQFAATAGAAGGAVLPAASQLSRNIAALAAGRHHQRAGSAALAAARRGDTRRLRGRGAE